MFNTRYILVLLCGALAFSRAVVGLAETKVSGSVDCDKADPMQSIAVPDRAGYAFAIHQHKCVWTKPIKVEGIDAKTFVNVVFTEVKGTGGNDTANGVTTYANGDKGFTREWGPFDGKAMTASGKWTFAGGTGKLSKLNGGGTYTCKTKSAEPGAGYTCNIEGSYAGPPPPPPPAAPKK